MIQTAYSTVRSLTAHVHPPIHPPTHRRRHSTTWATISLGFSLLFCPLAAWANPASPDTELLIAQQIIDGLPPAPPLPPAMLPQSGTTTPTQFQSFPSNPSVQVPAPQTTAPSPFPTQTPSSEFTSSPSTATTTIAAERYAVLVNGNSPLLLDQVRKIELGAFLQDHDGRRVIQAGLFSEPSRADQQVAALAEQGIGAEIVPVTRTVAVATPTSAGYTSSSQLPEPDLLPAAPVQREVVFGQEPTFNSAQTTSTGYAVAANSETNLPDNSYYVVIPGHTNELRDISVQVTRLAEGLAVQESSVVERDSPLGPHVIVGPFINRSAAFRWSDYLRAFGLLDSRVYYRR